MDPNQPPTTPAAPPQFYGKNPYQTSANAGYGQPQVIAPTVQQPAYQTPTYQQPAYQQPQSAQPVYQPGYQYGQPAQPDYSAGGYNYGYQQPQPTSYDPYNQFAGSMYGSQPSTKRRFPFSLTNKAFVGIVMIALIVAGVFGIAKISADSPDELFYSALDNQMELQSVHVMMTSSVPTLNSTTKLNYYLDVSDPAAPKAAGTAENAIAFLRTKTEVAAEFNAQHKDVFVRFMTPPYENWIATTEADKQILTSTKAINISRVRDLSLNASSVGGIILTGQFNKKVRSAAVKSLKERNAYGIISSELMNEEGAQLRRYRLKLNRDALRDIQKTASDAVGATFTDFSDSGKEMYIFVDTKRKLITKIDQTDDAASLTYTYSDQNQAFQASPPSGAVTVEKYLASF